LKNLSETKIGKVISLVTSSNLVRSSGVYTISSFINAALPLLLLPILTRKLSPADYGVVAMFQLVVSLVYPFIGMNLEGSISRKYFDKDNSDFPAYIGTCFILVAFSFLVVTGLFWLNLNQIQKVTLIPEQWLKYILVVAACQFITTVILVTFQVKVQPIKYGILQISQSIINVGLTILFVVILNKTWNGRIEAQIVTGVAFAIISIIVLRRTKQIRFNVKKADIQHALRFGVPLIPHALGGMLFTSIDRFFLTNLVGLEQTGNYTVAYQIGAVISIITFAFNNAYIPWLFENLNKNDFLIKKKLVKFTYLYFVLIVIGSILLLIIFPFIVSIFVGSNFKSIGTYSAFIVFGYVFQGMYYMVTNYIMYAEKTYLQALVTITIGLIKLPVTYFAIIWFGAVGASISFCISWFVFFISTWILSARVYKMPWNILKIL
jgi:O-antigen/teichoic acid export membrane protein